MSKAFTIFLGAAEFAGGLGVIFGVLAQLAAIGLILVMLGAIQKRFSFGKQASGVNQEQMDGATTDAYRNESRYRQHRRWKPLSDEVVRVAFDLARYTALRSFATDDDVILICSN